MARLASQQRWVAILAAAVLLSALGVLGTTHRARSQYAELQQLELRRWHLQEHYSRLLLEYSTRAAPHRVHRFAMEELGMTKPDLKRYRVVRP
jgi:cell division protein FtsL